MNQCKCIFHSAAVFRRCIAVFSAVEYRASLHSNTSCQSRFSACFVMLRMVDFIVSNTNIRFCCLCKTNLHRCSLYQNLIDYFVFGDLSLAKTVCVAPCSLVRVVIFIRTRNAIVSKDIITLCKQIVVRRTGCVRLGLPAPGLKLITEVHS